MAKAKRRAAKSATKLASANFSLPTTTLRRELLVRGSDHAFRQFLYDLAYVASLVEGVRRRLAEEIAITPPQYNILMVVAEYMGHEGVNIKDVADHLHVSGAFVTAETNKLEKAGFLVRLPNPDDGRSVLLRLSERSETVLGTLSEQIREYNDRFFASLSRDDFERISASLRQLIRGGESALEAFAPSPAGLGTPRGAVRPRTAV